MQLSSCLSIIVVICITPLVLGRGNLYGDDESDRSSERIEVESPVAATIDGDISITRREVEVYESNIDAHPVTGFRV